ncbi:MAG: ADP-ribosylglycohydrolase family protein [Verrucomicrobiota bacterium]
MSQPRIPALEGALVADALAMPVHWYYDRLALRRDYGLVDKFLPPKNPHPDSILWRSTYNPVNPDADILHDQAGFWGMPGVHYHQNLEAGENTLNFKLARMLYTQVHATGSYSPESWLELYVDLMRMRNWHKDTYVEEYHRHFFTNRAHGRKLIACGGEDIHIGGLASVPALFAALPQIKDEALVEIVQKHVGLTHRSPEVLDAATALTWMLLDVEAGVPLRESIVKRGHEWLSEKKATRWAEEPDTVVIGKHLSPACYIKESFPAALYLSWKYAADFRTGIIANAHVGGDNCHRGAVIGGLLGLKNGVPLALLKDLKVRPQENHVSHHSIPSRSKASAS